MRPLVPVSEILEQDRPQLDEPQRRLATGDDGVHAGAIAVVRTDATVAVTVEGGRIAAGPAIALARDEIDERGFLGLLHGLPPFATLGAHKRGGLGDLPGGRTRSGIGGLAQYRRPSSVGQEGSWVWRANPTIVPQCENGPRRLRRLARDEVDRKGAELVDDGVDTSDRIALQRTRPGRRAEAVDPLVGGHAQHPEHVARVGDEDR